MRNIRSRRRRRWPKVILWGFLAVLFVSIGVGVACLVWYTQHLKPVDPENKSLISVNVVAGSTPEQIADTLKEGGIISNSRAFWVYTRLNSVQNNLQAGKYRLSPSESLPEVVDHLVRGNVDSFSITFLPGVVLNDKTDTPADAKRDIRSSLLRAGFSDQDVDEAFAASYPEYNTTLFQDKPADADLEGYVYGETYNLNSSATAKDALKASFDEFWRVIQQNNLIQRFKAQGLNLHEGITLASIIQRESIGGDEAEIAQVFSLRLSIDMPLGADPTYQYIADKLGVPRDLNIDSPYNTRRFKGLPPGPIANAGVRALNAVADPADGDYLYFLSGDDNVTYFARTFAEHEANISKHCRVKCSVL